MKAIKSDGNGGLNMSKTVAATLAVITLLSLVWGISTSFSRTQQMRPVEMRVERLENSCSVIVTRQTDMEKQVREQEISNADRLARIETKLDALLNR